MARNRIFRVWQDPGQTIRIDDEVSETFTNAARIWPKESKRALRHVAFQLQKQMKAELRGSRAGAARLTALSGLTQTGSLTAFKTGRNRRRKSHPGGERGASLVQAIGYQQTDSGFGAFVGWLSPSAVRLGRIFQQGKTYEVTDKMRRLFWAAFRKNRGVLPIAASKTKIHIPTRNFMDPVHRKFRPKILSLFELRLARNLGIFDDQEFSSVARTLGVGS